MASEAFEDVYEANDGWTAVPAKAPGESYRYCVRRIGDEQMYFTEVVIPFRGVTLEALQARLVGEWRWWKHGNYKTISRHADGAVDFTFWPSPTPVVKLHCTMAPPQPLPGGGVRLFSKMRGTADGAYYFDLRPTSDGVVMTSRQLGIPRGLIPALMGRDKFARTHILSEIGEFSFPLPKGSGFVGLRECFPSSST